MSSPWTVKATKGGSGESFDSPPAGNHPARCVALIDLGTQEDDYQGNARQVHKVFLCWELTAEAKPGGGGNFVVGRDYTLSFAETAALRGIIEKWRGKAFADGEDFDLPKLLGQPCLLSLIEKVSNKGRTYAKIDGVSALPKGLACPPATVKPVNWWIEDDKPIPEDSWLPFVYGEPLKQVIERSGEWADGGGVEAVHQAGKRAATATTAGGGDADEAPF